MIFKCDGCGTCCRSINHIPIGFPYTIKNNTCEMLKDNKCIVYNDRPMVCNVEKTAEFAGICKQLWYEENKRMCFVLKNK